MSSQFTLKPLFTWRSAICDSDLPPDVRHVALTLSLHMSERADSARPSLEKLRRETARRKATVTAALATLEREGWLRIRRGGGRGRVNSYQATLPKGFLRRTESAESAPSTRDDTREGSERGTVSPPGTDSLTTTGPETVPRSPGNGPPSELEDVLPRGRTTSLDAPRPRKLAFDALAQATGQDPAALTKSAAGEVGTKLAEIRDAERARLGTEVTEEALAGEIRLRSRRYAQRHPDWALTPSALAKWWPKLGDRPEPEARASPVDELSEPALSDEEIAVRARELRERLAGRPGPASSSAEVSRDPAPELSPGELKRRRRRVLERIEEEFGEELARERAERTSEAGAADTRAGDQGEGGPPASAAPASDQPGEPRAGPHGRGVEGRGTSSSAPAPTPAEAPVLLDG